MANDVYQELQQKKKKKKRRILYDYQVATVTIQYFTYFVLNCILKN